MVQNDAVNAFFLLAVIFNCLFLALADYSHVDSEGNLTSEHSTRNYILENTDVMFVIIFALEFVLKIDGEAHRVAANGMHIPFKCFLHL